MHEGPGSSTSSPPLAISSLFDRSHPNGREVVSHFGFDLHFPNRQCFEHFFPVLINYLCLFWKNVDSCPLPIFYWVVWFFSCWVIVLYMFWLLTHCQIYDLWRPSLLSQIAFHSGNRVLWHTKCFPFYVVQCIDFALRCLCFFIALALKSLPVPST